MARVTILSWNGAGNQPPAIAIARTLRQRGHDVTFAGYAGQRLLFEGHGFPFMLLEKSSAHWRDAAPEHMLEVKTSSAWASMDHLHDVDHVAARTEPDVVVVDCLMFGALAALENKSIPTAVLVHSAPGALVPPGGVFEKNLIGRVNKVRAAAGRRQIDRLWDAWESFPAFSNSIRLLDPLAGDLPRSFAFVGPLVEPPLPSDWEPPWSAADARPLVLASFSTGPYWDQSSRIRRTLEALANRSYRVLVTSSGADAGSAALPANALVVKHAPHATVMPHASITVTHAGHGTVVTSLAHGVPLLCLPNRAADQPALAAQITRLGAGGMLDGDAATPEEIGVEVDRIVGDRSYSDAARRLATVISTMPGVAAAVRGLEQLAGGERPHAWSPSSGNWRSMGQ